MLAFPNAFFGSSFLLMPNFKKSKIRKLSFIKQKILVIFLQKT